MSKDNPNLVDALFEPTDPSEWSWLTRQVFTPSKKGSKDAPSQDAGKPNRR